MSLEGGGRRGMLSVGVEGVEGGGRRGMRRGGGRRFGVSVGG